MTVSLTKKNEVTIAVERKVRTKDGAGGYTTETAEIEGSPFSGRLIRKKVPALVEGAPGDTQVTQVVLVFPVGTDVRVNDVCTIGSVNYTVMGMRSYTGSVQADVEAVE